MSQQKKPLRQFLARAVYRLQPLHLRERMHGVGPKISGQIVWFKTDAIKLQPKTKKLSGENLTAFLIYGAARAAITLALAN
jgi:hypothetical protein